MMLISKRRYLVAIPVVLLVVCLLYVNLYRDKPVLEDFTFFNIHHTAGRETTDQALAGGHSTGNVQHVQGDNYSVFTEGCRIPLLDPFDQTVKGLYHKVGDHKCGGAPPLIAVNHDENRIKVDETVLKKYHSAITKCDFSNFGLIKGQDYKIWKNATKVALPFGQWMDVKSDFIEITCSAGGKIKYTQHIPLIQRKPELIKDRLGKLDKNGRPTDPKERLNIVVVATDSTSRLNFARQCPKTRKYLLEHLGGFEMLGFNKIGSHTYPNILAFTSGLDRQELKERGFRDNLEMDSPKIQPPIPFIWDILREQGYLTHYCEDWPGMGTFQIYGCKGFIKQPVDYYWRHFSLVAENGYCLKSEPYAKVQLDNTRNYLRKYPNVSKFAFTFHSKTTHDSPDELGRLDSIYREHIEGLETDGQLNNTLFVMMGDHGSRFGRLRKTFLGMMEDHMPLMIVVMPKWFLKKYPDVSRALSTNTKRLVTHFDMYATLKSLPSFSGQVSREETAGRGHSLLGELSKQRTCKNVGVPEEYCPCNEYRPIDVEDEHVSEAAAVLVGRINEIIFKAEGKCHPLTLSNISNARVGYKGLKLDTDSAKFSGHQVLDYHITVTVLPSEGEFQAVVGYDVSHRKYMVVGHVSRVNKYGNQSACVDDDLLAPYCLCKSLN